MAHKTMTWATLRAPAAVSFTVTNPFMGVTGQYLQAIVTLTRSTLGESPILYSLIADTSDYLDTNQPVNQAPVVNAGPDQTTTLPIPITLTGSVTDDGLPGNHSLEIAWSQLSGPGTATFDAPSSEQTEVNFSEAGSYLLQLTGNGGALSTSATLTVTVLRAQVGPLVAMGPAQKPLIDKGEAPYFNAKLDLLTYPGDGKIWQTIDWGWEMVLAEDGGSQQPTPIGPSPIGVQR
jgi:hypothetical protein